MRTNVIISLLFRLPFTVTNDTTNSSISSEVITCGTTATSFHKPLIVNGSPVSAAGQWPWHASIWHRVTRTTHSYVCGGTLLSELYVLTAGHCVSKDGNALNQRLITIQLGSTQQNLLRNSFPVQNLAVADIFLHVHFVERSFNADIALLAMRTRAVINEFVRPICLPGMGEDAWKLIGRKGVTVGFGMTETDTTSDELRQLSVPIVDYVTCLESNREVFGKSISTGILCAGDTSGHTVCNGDSGGGLYVQESNSSWTLRGVTSFTVQRGWNDSNCSLKDYSAFVNVGQYLEWIRYVMEHDEQEGYFAGGSTTTKAVESVLPMVSSSTPLPGLRTSVKKCKEYRRKGVALDGLNGSGQVYLDKNNKPQGLAYFISEEYALTTAELALDCTEEGAICGMILGKRVEWAVAHPNYTGGRDFNVALMFMPPASEPIWCLSTEPSTRMYFEGRQLKLSSVSARAPTWLEFDVDFFLPQKRGAVVYNDERDIVGLMHNKVGEDVLMTEVVSVLDWIESVVWPPSSTQNTTRSPTRINV